MLAGKDKEFTQNIVDHHRGKNIATKGIGGENTEPFDENAHQHGTEKGTDAGDCVEEENFDDEVIFASMKHPEDINDVGYHIRKKKRNAVTDH